MTEDHPNAALTRRVFDAFGNGRDGRSRRRSRRDIVWRVPGDTVDERRVPRAGATSSSSCAAPGSRPTGRTAARCTPCSRTTSGGSRSTARGARETASTSTSTRRFVIRFEDGMLEGGHRGAARRRVRCVLGLSRFDSPDVSGARATRSRRSCAAATAASATSARRARRAMFVAARRHLRRRARTEGARGRVRRHLPLRRDARGAEADVRRAGRRAASGLGRARPRGARGGGAAARLHGDRARDGRAASRSRSASTRSARADPANRRATTLYRRALSVREASTRLQRGHLGLARANPRALRPAPRSKSCSQRSSSACSASRERLCAASVSTFDQSSASFARGRRTSASRAAISASSCSSSLGRGARGFAGFGFCSGFGSGGCGRARAALLAAAQHLGPAAVVGVQLAVLDRERALGDRVEQRAVVRDEQHRAGKRVERRLERLAALEVEMVRRLVEHEEVRARRDGDREREPPPLAARQHGDRLLVLVPAGEEELAEQVLRIRSRRGRSSSARTAAPSRACRARAPAARSTRPRRRGRAATRPAAASRRPSIVSSSVVLPEPFGPTSATCSPRSSANDAPRRSSRSPMRSVEPVGLEHGASAARRLQELEAERARACARGARSPRSPACRSFSSRPICVSFACACFALSFLARKRSTKRSSRTMSACTRCDLLLRVQHAAPPSRAATRATGRGRTCRGPRRPRASPS